MPRHATVEIEIPLRDFSRGVVGGISPRGELRPNWLERADNLYGRPYRAMRVRPGSRRISTAILSDEPHSLMAFYAGAGNKLFVGAAAKVLEVQGGAYANQTLPFTPSSSDIWAHTNLNGLLLATQRAGAQTPIFYDGAWRDLKLPKPAAAVTFAADSNTGGTVDVGTHFYRVRWRFNNGSSLSGPVSAAHVVAGVNQTVNINANLVPGVARGDYLGWTLERTKVNGSVVGPFCFVADGTAATYADVTPDASLGYIADEGRHGEPPHLDGLTGFAGRIVGWAGSTLYMSNAIGDLEATGIANFDADLVYPVAKDDGDTVQVCVVVQNELLILKRRSVHVISGVDPDSFVLTSVVYADPARGSEAGCGGPRAACVIGGRAFFWGESGGLFVYERGSVKPAGWVEVGHYLDELNAAALDLLLLINHQGNYMLAWYPRGTVTRAEEQIIYDARVKQFWHWKGWRARDAVELKGGLFGNASLVFCDPLNRVAFPAIANGAAVTGAGIPAATTVNGAVLAGATSLILSAPATANAQNVTLTIAGVATARCNTTNGSTTVTITEYHCYAAFDGFRDEKDAAGAGGNAVQVSMQTPWLDAGRPEDWKELERVAITADGDQIGVAITIATDPPGNGAVVQMGAAGQGNDWAADAGSNPSDLEWDVGDWATDSSTESVTGLPGGVLGKRFRATLNCAPTGDFTPTELAMVGTLLPDREYDR